MCARGHLAVHGWGVARAGARDEQLQAQMHIRLRMTTHRVRMHLKTPGIPPAPRLTLTHLGIGDALAAVEKVEQDPAENVLADLRGWLGCTGVHTY